MNAASRPLDVAFVVQGDGRGHMTQALAVRKFLTDAGHTVGSVFLGTSPTFPAPRYFVERIGVPVTTFAAPSMVPDRSVRGMSVSKTAAFNARRMPAYFGAEASLRRAIRRLRPDVVVSFFDLIAAFVHLLSRVDPRTPTPPRVAIAHAFLLGHPRAAAAPPGPRGRFGLALLSRVTAAGVRSPVALSFDALPDRSALRVAPPLLRAGLARLAPRDDGYLLAYALNAGYARELAAWQARSPSVPVHCYVSGGNDALCLPPQPGFEVHDLDDEAFMRHMEACRAYVGTAGFESLCEAHYLGKPVLAVPVEGHYEQAFNAADAERAGVAWTGGLDKLDAFWNALPVPEPERVEAFRRWVARAPEIIVRAIEEAARGRPELA